MYHATVDVSGARVAERNVGVYITVELAIAIVSCFRLATIWDCEASNLKSERWRAYLRIAVSQRLREFGALSGSSKKLAGIWKAVLFVMRVY